MKKILIIVLGMGMVGSPVVQAQQTGQGATVPRQNMIVAQAPGSWTAPGSPAVAPAVLPAAFVPVMVIMGLTVVAVGASSTDTSTNH